MSTVMQATGAEHVIGFVGELPLSGDYSRRKFVLRDWQKDIIRKIFDPVDEEGKRIVRECGIWLPRKNGKTQLVASLCCYFLLADPTRGEIYSAAAEREQAAIVYRLLAGMIRAIPEAKAICTLVDSQKRIVNNRTGTLFVSLSSEAGTKHGYNPSVVVGDEIHVWKKPDLWTALTTGSGTRREPLFLTITTAGLYDKTAFEWDKYDYAKKVATGVFEDPSYCPIIYEAHKDADWLDEEVWKKCNPALGDFRSLDEMRTAAERAQKMPSLETEFRRLYLNQHTAQQEKWLNFEQWTKGNSTDVSLKGKPVWCGIDLSTKEDITAFVALGKDLDGYSMDCLFWIPEESAQRKEKEDRVPYSRWIREGYVKGTPGRRVDYRTVVLDVMAYAKRHQIQEVAIDPWNAGSVIEDLQDEGLLVVEIPQGFRRLNEPSRELEAILQNGDLTHVVNPCMDWMVNNVEVTHNPGGHIRPVKTSDTQRVDGVTALVMALSRAMHGAELKPSIYEQPGQLFL